MKTRTPIITICNYYMARLQSGIRNLSIMPVKILDLILRLPELDLRLGFRLEFRLGFRNLTLTRLRLGGSRLGPGNIIEVIDQIKSFRECKIDVMR